MDHGLFRTGRWNYGVCGNYLEGYVLEYNKKMFLPGLSSVTSAQRIKRNATTIFTIRPGNFNRLLLDVSCTLIKEKDR